MSTAAFNYRNDTNTIGLQDGSSSLPIRHSHDSSIVSNAYHTTKTLFNGTNSGVSLTTSAVAQVSTGIRITTITPSISFFQVSHALLSSSFTSFNNTHSKTSLFGTYGFNTMITSTSSASMAQSSFSSSSSTELTSSSVPDVTSSNEDVPSSTNVDSQFNPKTIFTSDSWLLLVYTQTYFVSGSDTKFTTGVLTTSSFDLNDEKATSTFKPTVITANLAHYKQLIHDDTKSLGSAKAKRDKDGTIAGSVVGSVVGLFLLSAVVLYLMKKRHRLKSSMFSTNTSFTHTNGKHIEHSSLAAKPYVGSRQLPNTFNNQSTESPNESLNPFQDEFDFQNRAVPPPVPAPRKTRLSAVTPNNQDLTSNSERSSSLQNSLIDRSLLTSIASSNTNSVWNTDSSINNDTGFFTEVFQ